MKIEERWRSSLPQVCDLVVLDFHGRREHERELGALLLAVATVAAAERSRVGCRAQVVRDHKLKLHRDGRRERAAWQE